MPLISVIVPVYKVEPYLHQCVDSILSQTFEDFELILVDDGSPDNCPNICDEYAKKDNRVIVIHKENGGLSSARNAGLDYVFAHSDSEYISFVDSDDYISNVFLKELYAAINSCDLSLCYHSVIDGGKIVDCNPEDKMVVYDNNSYWLDKFRYADKIVAWNKLYRKKLFDNIRYPIGKIHEDEFVIHHIIKRCYKIVLLHKELYLYRKRCDSISSVSKDGQLIHDYLFLEIILDRCKMYYNDNNIVLLKYSFASMEQVVTIISKRNPINKEIIRPFYDIYKKARKKGLKLNHTFKAIFYVPHFYFVIKKVINF